MAFFRNFATVGSFTLLSRGLGFVRELLTATLLGAGPVADAFVVAQRLPNFFRAFFAEGAMDSAFIPIYARKLKLDGSRAAAEFSSHILTILLVILGVFTAVALHFMPVIVAVLVPGFSHEGMRFDLGVAYCTITFGYLVLISITALQGGILNANGHFAPFAAAPAILNTITILFLLVVGMQGGDVALAGCWSLIVGGVAQMALLWFYCRRAGVTLKLVRPKWTKDIKQFFSLVGPGVLANGTLQLNGLISTILSSVLPAGTVSALHYADRLLQFPIGVIGIAIATALLPLLTSHIAAREKTKAAYYFSRALEVGLAASLPLALVLLLEGEPIIRVLFKHGAFDMQDVKVTAECLIGYAAYVPASILLRILTASYFASEDSRTPVVFAVVAIIVNFIGAMALMRTLSHIGIALAFTASVWLNVGLLTVTLLQRGLFRLDIEARRRVPRLIFSALALGLAFGAFNQLHLESWVAFIPSEFLQNALALSLKLLAGGLIYIVAVHFTGALRLDEMAGLLKRARGAPTEMDEAGL